MAVFIMEPTSTVAHSAATGIEPSEAVAEVVIDGHAVYIVERYGRRSRTLKVLI